MKRPETIAWKKFIGSFFYAGRIKGGGSYTSIIAGLLLYYFLGWNSLSYLIVFAGFLLLSILLSYNLLDDPSWFTLDELVGTMVTFAFHTKSIPTLLIGLVIFRLFDIFKLPFVKRVEKLNFGIVLDDIISGLIASCFLSIIYLIKRL